MLVNLFWSGHRLLLLLTLLVLLSSCGLGQCFKAEDIDKDNVRILVSTKPPELDKSDERTYWVNSGMNIFGLEPQPVSIQDFNINLCSGSKKEFSISPGTQTSKLFDVFVGDKLKVELVYDEAHIEEETCEGNDSRVFMEMDKKECIPMLGKSYFSKVTNSSAPSSNRFYPSPVNFSAHPWYNGKVASFYKKLTTKQMNECFDKKTGKIASDVSSAQCYSYALSSPCSNIVGKKDGISVSDLEKLPTFEINSKCENICGVSLNCTSSGCNKVRNSFCAFTETQIDSPPSASFSIANPPPSISYLPYLKIKISGRTSVSFPVVKDSTLGVSGVITNKAFEPFPSGLALKANNLTFSLDGNSGAKGGYTVSVSKDCEAATRRSLYYSVSETGPPNFLPGSNGSTNIDFMNNSGSFVIPKGITGTVYFGFIDEDGDYTNNTGYFIIQAFITKKASKIISHIVLYVRKYIFLALYGPNYETFFQSNGSTYGNGAVGSIYSALVSGPFLKIVRSILMLYISLYSAFFLIGVRKISIMDLTILSAKVGIIVKLLSPDSWEFFNKHLFVIFSKLPTTLINMFANGQHSTGDFEFLDQPFYRFTFTQTWVQILSLLFAGPFGWLMIFLILWSLWMMFTSIFELIITYFVSISMVALLLSLAPLFISMILFQRTKSIFDMWIAALSQNAMHPVVMFSAFALICQVVSGFAYSLLTFDVCDQCLFEAKVKIGVTFSLCLLEFVLPVGFSPLYTAHDYKRFADDPDTFMGMPISLAKIFMLVVSAHSMKQLVSFAGNIVLSIFGVVASDLSSVGHATAQGMLGMVGMDKESRDRRSAADYNDKKNNSAKASGKERTGRKGDQKDDDGDSKDSKKDSKGSSKGDSKNEK